MGDASHWAVKVRGGLVGGIDLDGTRIFVCEETQSFQVFQTRAQAEQVADAFRARGGAVVPVTCRPCSPARPTRGKTFRAALAERDRRIAELEADWAMEHGHEADVNLMAKRGR